MGNSRSTGTTSPASKRGRCTPPEPRPVDRHGCSSYSGVPGTANHSRLPQPNVRRQRLHPLTTFPPTIKLATTSHLVNHLSQLFTLARNSAVCVQNGNNLDAIPAPHQLAPLHRLKLRQTRRRPRPSPHQPSPVRTPPSPESGHAHPLHQFAIWYIFLGLQQDVLPR